MIKHAKYEPDYRDPFMMENIRCPRRAMHFYLVYRGPLHASGNRSKPDKVRDLRDQLHPQLRTLWAERGELKTLRQTAVVPREPGAPLGHHFLSTQMPDRDFTARPVGEDEVDLCAEIEVGGWRYMPLVRESLSLTCSLDILFLRRGSPGDLVLPGGDLDNRIKLLLDALTLPVNGTEVKHPPDNELTYCLLESDTLISGIDVSTGELLLPDTDRSNEVHLVIEVKINIHRVGIWNACLFG